MRQLLTLAVLVTFATQACSVQPWRPQSTWDDAEAFEDVRRIRVHRVEGSPLLFSEVEIGEDEDGKFLRGPARLPKRERRALGENAPEPGIVKIYFDEIRLVETRRIEEGRILANAGIGVVIVLVAAAAASVAVLAYCPRVYTFDGSDYHLESETFPLAFTPTLERSVFDPLNHLALIDGHYHLRIENRSFETHYLDTVALHAVAHAPDVRLGVSATTGEIAGFRQPTPALGALDALGHDVLAQVRDADDRFWDGGQPTESAAVTGSQSLRLRFPRPQNAARARLIVRGKNTAYAANQLSQALDRQFGAGAAYARLIRSSAATGEISQWIEGQWGWKLRHAESPATEVQALPFVGPLVTRQLVFELDLDGSGAGELELLIEGRPGAWSIDQVAIDYSHDAELSWRRLGLLSDERDLLDDADQRRLVMFKGDVADLEFDSPATESGQVITPVLEARGYYMRWSHQVAATATASGRPGRAGQQNGSEEK